MLKEELRKKILAKREIYPNWQEDSHKIINNFLLKLDLSNFKTFMLYYPHKKEVDTTVLIKKLLQERKTVVLPKVSGQDIKPTIIKDLDNLIVGYAGIKEPVGFQINPKEIDLIVVPAVAYDKEGYRIGYGKGYYDRFLPKLRKDSLKIGFCYDFQLLEKLPHEPHDFRVDLIITPTQIFKTKKEEVK